MSEETITKEKIKELMNNKRKVRTTADKKNVSGDFYFYESEVEELIQETTNLISSEKDAEIKELKRELDKEIKAGFAVGEQYVKLKSKLEEKEKELL